MWEMCHSTDSTCRSIFIFLGLRDLITDNPMIPVTNRPQY